MIGLLNYLRFEVVDSGFGSELFDDVWFGFNGRLRTRVIVKVSGLATLRFVMKKIIYDNIKS